MDTNWFEDNRRNWDDRAALHQASGYGIAELVADPTRLSTAILDDRERLGSLAGRRVIHLQCHLGIDTVSLARLGAERVVGVDLSGESLRRAREITTACGAQVEYVQSNVYDARTAVEGQFDLVYTSLGVLCWLPDVVAWARVIASLLAPGGRLVFRDDHPMFMTIGDDVSDGLRIEQPYFQQAEPLTWEDEGSYVAAPEGTPAIVNRRNHQWNHGVGEIVTALIRAGLVIDAVDEMPLSAWCPWPELMIPEGNEFRLREHPERLALQLAVEAHLPG